MSARADAVLDAANVVRGEFAQVARERDRARRLAVRLEGICAERERLLWLAVEADTSLKQAQAGRAIAAHLRETAFVPGMEAGA